MFENGSVWLKADFHLHTRADKEFKYAPSELVLKDGYSPENTFPGDYVDALENAHINIGIITNHNKFKRDEFLCLRKKALKKNILLIPGLELSVNEGANGVHTLIAFSDEWISEGKDFIQQFLTTVFAGKVPEEYENENGKTEKNLIDVVKTLDGFCKDYFFVFAHVEQGCGLLYECAGGKLKEWTHSNYASLRNHTLGLQKVRTEANRKNLSEWFGGWYPAELEGSDCKNLAEIGTKSNGSWLKIGELSFAAVKYALQNYHERVKKDSPERTTHSYIKSISFDGGAFDGKKISFSPELNTLIGIRGSGKSSVLEALRYGLGIKMQPSISDREYKTNLVDYIVGSGGKISIEAVDRFGQEYVVSRILKNTPDIYIDSILKPGLSICETIVCNPLYFGQKELSSNSETFGNNLVEKLVGSSLSDVRLKIEQKKQKIKDIVFYLSKTSNVDEAVSENNKKLKDAEFNLQKFSEAGVDEKLKIQTGFDMDERWIVSVQKLLFEIKQETADNLAKFESGITEKLSYTSMYNADFIIDSGKILKYILKLIEDLKSVYQSICAQIDEFSQKSQDFADKKKSEEENFAKIRRELESEIKKNGSTPLNLDDFKLLNVRISQTKEMLTALKGQKDEQAKMKSALLTALGELNELHREEFRIIQSELNKINSSETGLAIKAEFKGDKDAFLSMMKSTFRGSGIRESLYKELVTAYMDFSAIYKDSDFFKRYANIKNAFEKIFTEQMSALLTYRVPDKITILYQGKDLSLHSLGQRASSLILFILGRQANDVIIIDQPEDDLDNQTIYNDVIKLMKKIKPNVQCIFATHNANFPVLGDAEMIHVFDFSAGTVSVSSGNIDTSSTQKQIVGIMEGGKEAFAKRKEIYQSWKL